MAHSCGLITSCDSFYEHFHEYDCARSMYYGVEPLFTVKRLVLQIPYLQDGRFLWYSYMMKLVENLQLASSCPQHSERGLA